MGGYLQRGYQRVHLNQHPKSVHRLVLEAFVGPCPAGHECGHVNGVRDDNRLENLVWLTPAENLRQKLLHGRIPRGDASPMRLHPERVPRGETHGRAKLTDDDVRAIRAAVAAGEMQIAQADRYGVRPSTVGAIVAGRSWRHLLPVEIPTAGSSDLFGGLW